MIALTEQDAAAIEATIQLAYLQGLAHGVRHSEDAIHHSAGELTMLAEAETSWIRRELRESRFIIS